MKITTTNIMLGILIAASLVTSYKLHQIVKRYDALKIQVDEVVEVVEVKIEEFTLKYGDEITEGLKEEADVLITDAALYADSLRVKASEYLKTIKTTKE